MICICAKFVTRLMFSNSSNKGGDVYALPSNLRFKVTLDKLDLVRHKFESLSPSNMLILSLPMSQFLGKLGWLSR